MAEALRLQHSWVATPIFGELAARCTPLLQIRAPFEQHIFQILRRNKLSGIHYQPSNLDELQVIDCHMSRQFVFLLHAPEPEVITLGIRRLSRGRPSLWSGLRGTLCNCR